jgi:pyrroloquinoline-quinone synthase
MELGCVARSGGRNFLDLRSGEEAPKHCTSMTTEQTLHALDGLICERSILQHPFYRAWQCGELTRAQLATYSRVYYPHVAAFPDYLRNTISCATDPSTKLALEDNLHDELSNPAPHPELWLDFAAGTGQNRKVVKGSLLVTGIAESISTFDRLTSRDIASGLTALYAYESQQPEVAAQKLHGLRESYGIRSPEALSYFEVHTAADIEHRAGERAAIARCLDAGTSSALIINAANEALDAYWNLLDSVCEEANVQLTGVSA